MFLQWSLGYTSPLLFALIDKKSPIMHILHSETKYVEQFGVKDHNTGEVVTFVG